MLFRSFDKDFFDPNQLREILIYIPSLNKYIVPNRYEYGIGEPPDNILGNYAIYIDQNLDYYFSEIISTNILYAFSMISYVFTGTPTRLFMIPKLIF